MSIKKVCFLTNYNQYETKRYFTVKLAEAMERAGIATMIVDVQEKKLGKNAIKEIYTFKPDFTASFHSFVPDESGAFLFDHLKIPHLSILVDPSLYSVPLIRSPYSIISCVDAFDYGGLQSQKFDRLLLFHHAVEKELEEVAEVKEKEYEVVFFGSCYDYESLKKLWQSQYPEEITEALEKAAGLVLSNRDMPLQEAFVKGWSGAKLDKKVDFLSLFKLVDSYSRGLDRIALIRAIKEADVHIFGDVAEDEDQARQGWDHYFKDQSNVTVHPSVPFEEQMQILRRSKICLNSNPFFKDGSHERLFTGPANRALVATNNTLFSRAQFVDKEDILLYDSSDLAPINDKINAFLSDEERRQKAVLAARKKVFSLHSWDQRVKQLQEEMPALIAKVKQG